ncbi:uncharacterized protein KQ657_002768 [Scheffersomyces spartinae]|uniref:Uncharacterized protein n=1 Tax=Scheffersomyces spartinae TaxID=45513 RepID=A0A9P7V5X3_9ASCO|nr:uncharacterized protein KQ657_002768 [Scheffersomyces spartinae]KAG7191803.1 hypothetical protein KQ657_002768 [Scheffersomyces spartinae]
MSYSHEKLAISKQELQALHGHLQDVVLQHLDIHLPQTVKHDPLRNQVGKTATDIIESAFVMAKDLMVVDGVDGERYKDVGEILAWEPKEVVEDLDTTINNELREVLVEYEKEVGSLTQLRRTLPQQLGQYYDTLVADTDEHITDVLTEIDHNISDEENDQQLESLEIDNDSLKRYIDHFSELQEIKKSLPQRKADLEKLQDTVKFLQYQIKSNRNQ